MKEKKTRIFWDPFEVSDYISRERWLEERAAKGWKLVRYTGRFPRFEKTTPFKARYRLDYHHDKNMDDEQIALYEAAGWEFVDTLGEQFYIFTTTDPNAEELHTDPEMQAYSLKKLLRTHVVNMIFAVLFAAFYIGLMLLIFTKNKQPLTELLRIGPGFLLAFLLSLVLLLYLAFSQGTRFTRIWRQLHSSDAFPSPVNYHKAAWREGITSVFVLIILVNMLFGRFLLFPKAAKIEIADYTEPLPFLQLHEIEPSENFRYAYSKIDDTNWANQLETSSTLFAPKILKARQYSNLPSTEAARDSYLCTEFFTVRYEAWAAQVVDELRANAEHSFAYRWTTLSVPGTDEAYYYADGITIAEDIDYIIRSAGDLMFQNDGYQFLFLRSGNQVIKVCYHGAQNLSEFADEYAALLTQ
ncbi:MAG: DUF2812 domain-containing protein [Ruminococcaceae bacterium]|nr:DUF2812 domain-containing protein [Oscillospiraceae bacterium]